MSGRLMSSSTKALRIASAKPEALSMLIDGGRKKVYRVRKALHKHEVAHSRNPLSKKLSQAYIGKALVIFGGDYILKNSEFHRSFT